MLYAPDGTQLADNDDRSSDPHYTNSLIDRVMLPVSGIYRIEVRDLLNQNAGGYTLVIDSLPPGAPDTHAVADVPPSPSATLVFGPSPTLAFTFAPTSTLPPVSPNATDSPP